MSKSRKRTAALLLLALIGLAMILAPRITGWRQAGQLAQAVDTFRQRQEDPAVATVAEDSASEEPVYPELREAMERYNRALWEQRQAGLVDAWSYQAAVIDLTEYGIEGETVGILSIPSIDVEMPLYLGCTWEHMAQGFAQLSQTSLPVGGENTNCVVAGHRGWNGAPYMRDADRLEIGDMVYLTNLWETLEYQIVEIAVIEPNEIDKILIRPGRDLLTLLTCTPYGVGSHRLILIAERVQ